jgi:hypothetical protein
MPRFIKTGILAVLILGFFVLMSRIDYTVHSIMYNYGLRFSYDWANQYWIAYDATFVVFSLIVGYAYWFGSRKTKRDLKVAAALLLTINLLALGGLQDIMFFVLWSGGLPPSSVVWWWVPWTQIIGTWNSLTQVGLTTLAACLSSVTWMITLRRQKPRKLPPT